MIVSNSTESICCTIPNNLMGKVEFQITYPLSEDEATLFGESLYAVAQQLIDEHIIINTRATIIFTNDGTFEMSISTGALGMCTDHIIVFAMGDCKRECHSKLHYHTVFAEELCHCFWNEYDEVKVKHIVTRVLQHIYKGITINEIYKMETVN